MAQTLVSAAPRLIGALFVGNAKRVETALDPAGTSACATRAGAVYNTVVLDVRTFRSPATRSPALPLKERLQIPAAMDYVQNVDGRLLSAIKNQVLSDRKTSVASP